jgi:hypothetical protein
MANRFLFDGAQIELQSLPIQGISAVVTQAWIKIAGVWKQATVWIKVAGTWKTATPNIKVSGTWK